MPFRFPRALSVLMLSPLSALAHVQAQPDDHAPAGIMYDHLHKRGEVMVGLNYQRSRYAQWYQGSQKVDEATLAAAGFTMGADSMTMEMVMLDLMYAWNDSLTFMLMPHYMQMDMSMVAIEGPAMGHEQPDHHENDHNHDHHASHGTSGLGDTTLALLYRIPTHPQHEVIAVLGLSVPTGSVTEKNADGTLVHYEMQLGSGTWDFLPTLTYTGRANHLSWGGQLNAAIRLENANRSGYVLGDRYQASLWGATRLADWISLSARVTYWRQGTIGGHYNGPHRHSSPADFQENYGGEFVDAGLGANMRITGGPLAGLRVELEWLQPIEQNYNGFQLGMDDSVQVNFSYALRVHP